ncbi:MAG: extracellular solute-binding protein [Rhodospirillaceae bacterium]|nr:extracellular solute-binding protein [Rhodospirillaceae bacterium]
MRGAGRRNGAARPVPTVGRRTVLKAGAAAAGAVAAGPLAVLSRSARAADRLRVLTWPGYEEKNVAEEFEDTHGIKIEFKVYIGGEQMLRSFNRAPRGTYDNVLVDAEYVHKLAAIDAIEPYSPEDIPELANYHPRFRNMRQIKAGGGRIWGTATRFGFYAMSYNADRMSREASEDWNSLFLPELAGRIGVLDWYLPNMGIASLAVHPNTENPYDLSDGQLGAVRAWLLRLRPQVGMLGASSRPIVQAMIEGDIVAAMIGDLDIDLKFAGYKNFEATIPKQGGIRWQEVATVCKQSRNKDLALEWIRYVSQAHVQAKLGFARAFKARGPNLKIADHWTAEQNRLMGYDPDPENRGRMRVETLIDRSVGRDLPVQQDAKAWIDIFNEFRAG